MSITKENRFKMIHYEYEDISDDIISQLIQFKVYREFVTNRSDTSNEMGMKFFHLYVDGYLDRQIYKYDDDKTILIYWRLSCRGEDLLNSKRMISYNRDKTIERLLS